MTSERKHRRRMKPRARHRTALGAKPGTLSISPDALQTQIRVVAYDKDRIVEQEVRDPAELQNFLNHWPIVWVDVVGLGGEAALRSLAKVFHIHPLALEDIVHVHQRAKVDDYPEHLFCTLRIPDGSNEQLTEQFSVVLGRNYVVTFQERPGDCFGLIRDGLRTEQSLTRQGVAADYLAYRLIDASIDAYFPTLEKLGDRLDQLDEQNSFADTGQGFHELHTVRRELLLLRRAIWPLRDAISELRSESTRFISDSTRIYLRDCYDHTVQLIDLLESYRDIAGDVRDYYLSTISNRMNEIMKTLTVIATVFLPLSFIAGVFGMNFNTQASPWNMPELNWRFGYPLALGTMAVVAGLMIWFFKRRGWLEHFTLTESESSRHEEQKDND